ncbi:MAG TPA: ABC transporter ATP-binding protein [Flavobacterium sp.]|jgi:ABC-type sulfate/molybdate transport systems ATPase subunit
MLTINNISFSYGSSQVIRNISFAFPQGVHVAVIGESGSGKSTLLKLLYGQYDLNNGSISLNGKQILGPKFNLIPGEDAIKYLAQDFGLMPYITAAENVGKFLSNTNKSKKQQRILELLEMVGMADFANVKPKFLSGGQQQRVALARVLALEPAVLLLDEPFSQIDTFRANTLRRSLFEYLRQKNITCLIATHDAADVLAFADEVIVMRNGKIAARGRPHDVYQNPKSAYVASLFDDVNEIPSIHFPGYSQTESLLVYPHQLQKAANGLTATVTNSFFRGSHYLIEALYAHGKLLFVNADPMERGTCVTLAVNK